MTWFHTFIYIALMLVHMVCNEKTSQFKGHIASRPSQAWCCDKNTFFSRKHFTNITLATENQTHAPIDY